MISIIIPVYNKENYIVKAIQSIERQTYKNYEIIIVNDGSTDNSLEICQSLANNNDKIIIIDQVNQGPSEARNTGLKYINGDKIVFIDADDEIEINYLEELERDSNLYDLTICGYKMYEEQKQQTSIIKFSDITYQIVNISDLTRIFEKKLLNNLWNKIFKADIIKNNNIRFIPEYSLGEDTLFVLEYFKYISTNIKMINIPLYKYTLKKVVLTLGTMKELMKKSVEYYIQKIK